MLRQGAGPARQPSHAGTKISFIGGSRYQPGAAFSAPHSKDLASQCGEGTARYSGPHAFHQLQSPRDVVQTDESWTSWLAHLKEVADVAQRVLRTDLAFAIRVDGVLHERVPEVLDV